MDDHGTLTAERPTRADPKGRRVTEPPGPRRWYTVQETADLLKMSREWTLRKIRSRELRAKRIHGAGRGEYRICDLWIDEFMESLPDAREPRPGAGPAGWGAAG